MKTFEDYAMIVSLKSVPLHKWDISLGMHNSV